MHAKEVEQLAEKVRPIGQVKVVVKVGVGEEGQANVLGVLVVHLLLGR